MPTYTSTQTGDWNNPATWGGGGWPNASNDVVNIGHAVTYNVNDLATLIGNMIIASGGTLSFATGQDTGLALNNTGVINVQNGGTLAIGAAGSPLPAAYMAKIVWPAGSGQRNGLVVDSGGTLSLYGDPAVYGGSRYADLDSDWASGQTLYLRGDFADKWSAGQKFAIHKNPAAYGGVSDTAIYTIASVGAYDSGGNRTPVTISEAAPGVTYTALRNGIRSRLVNLARNIRLIDSSVSESLQTSGTRNVRFSGGQYYGTQKVIVNNVHLGGIGMIQCQSARFDDSVWINAEFPFYACNEATLGCDVIGNGGSAAVYSCSGVDYSGVIYACGYGLYACWSGRGAGRVAGCSSHGLSASHFMTFRGEVFGCGWGAADCYGLDLSGAMAANASGGFYNCPSAVIRGGPVANTTLMNSFSSTGLVLEDAELSGVRRKYRAYPLGGTVLPLVSGDTDWRTPPSGESEIYQLTPNNMGLRGAYSRYSVALSPIRQMACWCEAGARAVSFQVYPLGWSTALNQDELIVEASYLDEATGGRRALAVTSAGTFANDGWRTVDVSFTPGQAGVVYFNLSLRRYQAGASVIVDPVWAVS